MKKYLLFFTLLISSFFCYAQDVKFNYKYFPLSKTTDFNVDKKSLYKEAWSLIFKNTSVNGVVYQNGTLLSYNSNDDVGNDTALWGLANINITANLKMEGKTEIFFTPEIACSFDEKDTVYYFVDTTTTCYPTGKIKMIDKWKCKEYKSDKKIYKCYSIWVCDKIPASVKIFPFKGIKNGIVELDNTKANLRISLTSYKKGDLTDVYQIPLKTPQKSMDFLADYNNLTGE